MESIIEKLGITAVKIKGFPSYTIDTNGIVVSYMRNNPREIKRPLNRKGYAMVMLYNGEKRKLYAIHRLVAEHFIPNKSNNPQVNHIDGNKLNNNINNLEWVTASENIQHSYDKKLTPSGENHHQSKLTENNVRQIKTLLSRGFSQRKIAKMFNVSQCPISEINRGLIWKHIFPVNHGKK
jgi:predicted XRE-type DNA-binding protein